MRERDTKKVTELAFERQALQDEQNSCELRETELH